MERIANLQLQINDRGVDAVIESAVEEDDFDTVKTIINLGYKPADSTKSKSFLTAVELMNFPIVKYLAEHNIYHVGGTHTVKEDHIDYMGEYSRLIRKFDYYKRDEASIDKLLEIICWCTSHTPMDGAHESFLYSLSHISWDLEYAHKLIQICLDKKWFVCDLSWSCWDDGAIDYFRLHYLLTHGFDNTKALCDVIMCQKHTPYTELVLDYVEVIQDQWFDIDEYWYQNFNDLVYEERIISSDEIDNMKVCITHGMPVDNSLIQLLTTMSHGQDIPEYGIASNLVKYIFELKRSGLSKEELIVKWKESTEEELHDAGAEPIVYYPGLVDTFINQNWV